MSQTTPITILIDDRLRLLASALAATDFPQTSQARKRYHAHAHARATHKYMQDNDFAKHPAIVGLQTMLNQGIPIEALFTLVMLCDWEQQLAISALPDWVPPEWNSQLWDFYQHAKLADWWAQARQAWDDARQQSASVFTDKVYFKTLLSEFVGEINESLVFAPNLLYPADREVGIRVGQQLISLVPPPLAWGESSPWRYDEETRLSEHTYPMALAQYARLVMLDYLRRHADALQETMQSDLPISDDLKAAYPTWEDQFLALFQSAVVAIYLEDYMNKVEARGFMLMEKRVRKMQELPGTVSVLRRFLNEKGNRYDQLSEFLSVFPKQLRVAKRIVTI